MRHVALLIAVIGLFAVPASLASASGMPTRAPVPDSANTATFPAGLACDFTLQIEPVVNNEYTLTFPAEPNGDVVQIVSGYLLERFTNLDTAKSIVLNTSAKATLVFHTDGSLTIDASGPQPLAFLAGFGGGRLRAYTSTTDTPCSTSARSDCSPSSAKPARNSTSARRCPRWSKVSDTRGSGSHKCQGETHVGTETVSHQLTPAELATRDEASGEESRVGMAARSAGARVRR
jgi:hypothetical protein